MVRTLYLFVVGLTGLFAMQGCGGGGCDDRVAVRCRDRTPSCLCACFIQCAWPVCRGASQAQQLQSLELGETFFCRDCEKEVNRGRLHFAPEFMKANDPAFSYGLLWSTIQLFRIE